MRMKQILKLSAVFAALATLVAVASCAKEEALDTDQYSDSEVLLKAYGPQPVVRGGTLRFVGSNLDKVVSVTIPGDNVITDIEVVSAGKHSEIRVKVPKETSEPGYPVLALADGTTLTGKTAISYSEPITITSVEPGMAVPGTEITIKGDYLNLIHEAVFTNKVKVSETAFTAHDRYTIKLKVPEKAQTGKLSLGTLDELALDGVEGADALLKNLNLVDAPNEFVVTTALGQVSKTAYKAGETVTIAGTNMNLVDMVLLKGAKVTEFEADGRAVRFPLPATVTDGPVTLVMASGVEVAAGEITTVVPTRLSVSPAPVKNGAAITIKGNDLDLVTGVSLPHAGDVEFAGTEALTLTVPEAAQAGDIELALENGKSVTVAYTLVEPVVTGFSENPAAAGSPVVIEGKDLDLVAAVTFAGGAQAELSEASETALTVSVPTAAETGVLVLNLKNGASVEAIELEVSKPAGAYIPVFPEELYVPGQIFIIAIENGDHLTGVQVDGVDVNYILNDGTLYFSIPDEAKRGSQLTLVSDNGSVTYTMNIDPGDIIETTLWTGNLAIAGWANNEMRDNLIFTGVEMQEGQQVRFYGEFADWWCLQFFDGHWGEMTLGFNDEKHHMVSARVVPEAQEQGFFALRLTAEIIEKLQSYTDWGYWGIIQGEGVTLTKITYYEDNSDGTEIWTGPVEITWGDGGRVALPTAAFQVAKPGQKLRLFYTQKFEVWGQAQFNDGSWAHLSMITAPGFDDGTLVPTNVYGWFEDGILDRICEITLTPELLEHLLSVTSDYEGVECSVIIQGSDIIFNKVTIK